MHLRLISFALCPFVQRAVAMLREKNVAHDVEYIDLKNKPDWFLAISPRGKVPVLVADDVPLFESQAICEFIEEAYPENPLFSDDPIQRARDRAWFAFAGEDLLFPLYRITHGDEETAKKMYALLGEKLDRLESELTGDYLSKDGRSFGMADVAMSSALRSLDWARRKNKFDLLTPRPKVDAWTKRVLARDSVKAAVPGDYDAQTADALASSGAWLAEHSLTS